LNTYTNHGYYGITACYGQDAKTLRTPRSARAERGAQLPHRWDCWMVNACESFLSDAVKCQSMNRMA
jgi:hypothetical protein